MDQQRHKEIALLFSTFVISICALVYELLEGTISSYLLGDSIYQFSLTIGLFLSAMGIGAWISRYIEKNLALTFINLQLLIALLGGFSTLALFFAFAVIDNYTPIFFIITITLGAMIGIEIPLVMRMLEDTPLKFNISNLFTADYIGALFAALLFPIVLLPQLGIIQSGFFMGLLNAAVALLAWFVLKPQLERQWLNLGKIITVFAVLFVGFFYANPLFEHFESRLYKDEVIYTKQTPYQRLSITHNDSRIRFFINGALQFDSFDEYRYHEMLIHPAMSVAKSVENILVIGGGDGLAIREILKYPHVKKVTLVDLDPEVTKLFSNNQQLKELNQNAFDDKRVEVVNMDAWKYLEDANQLFDLIFIDLPDPNNISLSRLYSTTFYTLVKNHLSFSGIFVTQATSPLYAKKAFWCIDKTIQYKENELMTYPYHAYIPSFGAWGFILASKQKVDFSDIKIQVKTAFLTEDIVQNALVFPIDMEKVEVKANRLSDHLLLKYYKQGWEKWYQ